MRLSRHSSKASNASEITKTSTSRRQLHILHRTGQAVRIKRASAQHAGAVKNLLNYIAGGGAMGTHLA